MAKHCRRWNSLPLAGGLLDQPAGLLDRMAIAENAYDTGRSFAAIRPGKGAEWVEANPAGWDLICEANGWQIEKSAT